MSIQIQDHLTAYEISKDTAFVIKDSSFISPSPALAYSMVFFMPPQDIVIIDTSYTPNNMEAVLKWIDEKFGKDKKITVINTHHHVDRLGGNKVLIDRNIDVYASKLIDELLDKKEDKVITGFKEIFLNTSQSQYLQFTPPNKSITLTQNVPYAFKIDTNPEAIYLLFPEHAHSEDKIVVLISDLKILFGGCMIFCLERKNLGYLNEGNMTQWKESYKNLISFIKNFPSIEYVIPGHPLPEYIDFSSKMLEYTNILIDEELARDKNLIQ